MKDYIEEHQNSIDPFAANREYLNRPSPLHLARSPKLPQPREVTWKASLTLRNYINQEE